MATYIIRQHDGTDSAPMSIGDMREMARQGSLGPDDYIRVSEGQAWHQASNLRIEFPAPVPEAAPASAPAMDPFAAPAVAEPAPASAHDPFAAPAVAEPAPASAHDPFAAPAVAEPDPFAAPVFAEPAPAPDPFAAPAAPAAAPVMDPFGGQPAGGLPPAPQPMAMAAPAGGGGGLATRQNIIIAGGAALLIVIVVAAIFLFSGGGSGPHALVNQMKSSMNQIQSAAANENADQFLDGFENFVVALEALATPEMKRTIESMSPEAQAELMQELAPSFMSMMLIGEMVETPAFERQMMDPNRLNRLMSLMGRLQVAGERAEGF